MKNREYRVVKRGGKFYPQVRFKMILWFKWYRITEYANGYGLSNTWNYGKEQFKDADAVCMAHEKWYVFEKNAKNLGIIPCNF
jgi:hypothetical protein